MSQTILVTGGCGFIGSNFIQLLLQTYEDIKVRNLDLYTYAANAHNIATFEDDKRHTMIVGSINDKRTVRNAVIGVQEIINFAAESHVDNSITDSGPFLRTNVIGTQMLLDAAREFGVQRFVQISTDEVYGDMGGYQVADEASNLKPRNPYAASKAAADLLVLSYVNTFGFPAIITRCSNNYGPHQHVEKFIPQVITNALRGNQVKIYGDGSNVREWLYVSDHCTAIDLIRRQGQLGQIYNISGCLGSNVQYQNIDIANMILRCLKKPTSLLEYVEDRPGHDQRYAMSCYPIRRMGWVPTVDLETGLQRTIDWFISCGDSVIS